MMELEMLLLFVYVIISLIISFDATKSDRKKKNKTIKEKLDIQATHIIVLFLWIPLVVISIFSASSKSLN